MNKVEDLLLRAKINQFISHFRLGENCFLYGCCYWFTSILSARFHDHLCTLMYNPVDNHFAMQIEDVLYNVTGEISKDGYIPFEAFCYTEPLEAERIFHQCILFDE